MATYAEVTDVTKRWAREASALEVTLIETRLDDVERMIRRRISDLDEQVADGDIDPEDVKQVEADSVLRLVRNPEGYLQETDGDYSYMLQRDLASGKLEITSEEWESLGIRPTGMSVIVPRLVMPT